MKKAFMGSIICRNGIVGGGIYIEDKSVSFKTNKLTVDRKYKNLVLSIGEVAELSWKWVLFPIASFRMESGERYKFIIFNKWRFDKCFNEIWRV